MTIVNLTNFEAAHAVTMSFDGNWQVIAVVKATYTWDKSGTVSPAPSSPIVMLDEFFGDPASSGLLLASDIAPAKPRLDVLLAGAIAFPTPITEIEVGLAVGGAKLAVRRLEKDPLENWMKQIPWARESKYRIANFDELVTAFQRALVGLHADIRCGLTGFDVTVESRIVQSPAQIYLGLEWVSDAGAMQSAMAPMTQAECLGQNRFRHQEFASPVKQVIARIRLLLNGEWYPDEPTVFKFPS